MKDYSRYLDDGLYFQCKEYIKLYLILDELTAVYDFDSIDDFYVRISILLKALNVSLSRLLNENYDIVTDMDNNVERFNYKYTFSDYAVLNDINNDDFNVKVHNEDVEVLDTLLNNLYNNVEDLRGANHNLNRVITNYNDLLCRKLDEFKDNDDIVSVLESLQRELL